MKSILSIVIVLSAAFIFKVWNEREMNKNYERQAVALERIANAAEKLLHLSPKSKSAAQTIKIWEPPIDPEEIPTSRTSKGPDSIPISAFGPSRGEPLLVEGPHNHVVYYPDVSLPTLGGTAK